jgi:hypothetical protein
MDEVTKVVSEILTMSETAAIIKIALILATVGLSIFIGFKTKKFKRDASQKEAASDATRNEQNSVKQNRQDNQQVQSDSQRADDFLNGG